MSKITQMCNEILAHHTRLNRTSGILLRPGLSTADVVTKALTLPFKLPDSVANLYSWRDGTTEGQKAFQDMWLFPGYFLLSLDRSIETYRRLVATIPDAWASDCLPLFASGSGDYYGIRCEQQATRDGLILEYLGGDPELQPMFSSLEAMFRTLIRCFEAGIFFVAEGGECDVDDEGFENESTKCDPSVER